MEKRFNNERKGTGRGPRRDNERPRKPFGGRKEERQKRRMTSVLAEPLAAEGRMTSILASHLAAEGMSRSVHASHLAADERRVQAAA